MHLPTKLGQGCQLHQQLSLGQFFGEWENRRLQYKTEWDCFRFVMFLILECLFISHIGLLLTCIAGQLQNVSMLYIQFLFYYDCRKSCPHANSCILLAIVEYWNLSCILD